MSEPFLPHIVTEEQELEAIASPPSPVAALLWLAFVVALACAPAVVIAAWQVLL